MVPAETLVRLAIVDRGIEGEVSIAIAPGTVAEAQRRALDAALAGPLLDGLRAELDLVLAARPSSYALAQPGKDDLGRMRFIVRARAEGDQLVPALAAPKLDGARRRPRRR